MRRIQYHRYGGPEGMRLETYELPAPGKSEVLVRVKAASINPLDWKIRRGDMKFMTGWRFPRAMGQDFSGIVEGTGDEVTGLRKGDAVLGAAPLRTQGAFAEMLITGENRVVRKPASLSFEDAAILPTAGVAAWRALVEIGRLRPGQRVFVNGALGGVGQAAVHIAKAMGASVAGRVGPNALEDARSMGLDPALDYTQDVPASLNRSFDIVFDANGSLTPSQGDALAKRGGVVVDTNPSAGKVMRSLLSRRRKVVMAPPTAKILQKIADLAGQGKLPISIGRVARLEDSVQLIGDLEAGLRVKGKAVIVVP